MAKERGPKQPPERSRYATLTCADASTLFRQLRDNANRTLQNIEHRPALPTDYLEKLREMRTDFQGRSDRFEKVIKSQTEQSRQADQRHSPRENELRKAEAKLAQIEATSAGRPNREPQVQAARHDVEIARKAADESRAAVESAQNALAAVEGKPNDQISRLVVDQAAQNEDLVELYRRIVAGEDLAEKGAEATAQTQSEYTKARDYHLTMVVVLLVTLGLLVIGAALALYWLIDTRVPDADHWVAAAVIIGIRITAVATFAWLFVFVGRLQSQHAQQAVWYRERIAGLEASRLLLQHGDPGKRQEIVGRMMASYLSFEHNAFRPSPPERKRSTTRELRKLAEAAAPLLAAAKPKV